MDWFLLTYNLRNLIPERNQKRGDTRRHRRISKGPRTQGGRPSLLVIPSRLKNAPSCTASERSCISHLCLFVSTKRKHRDRDSAERVCLLRYIPDLYKGHKISLLNHRRFLRSTNFDLGTHNLVVPTRPMMCLNLHNILPITCPLPFCIC